MYEMLSSLIQPDNASISLFPGKVLVEKGVESAWSWIGYCVGHVYLQRRTHSSKATQVNLIHPVTHLLRPEYSASHDS